MSKPLSIKTDITNVDTDTGSSSRPTSSNARHTAVYSGERKKTVRRIANKLPRFPKQFNVKGVSDSGGSSADEHGKFRLLFFFF